MRCIRLALLFLVIAAAASTAQAQYPAYYPTPQPYPYPYPMQPSPYPYPYPMQVQPQGMLPAQGQLPALRATASGFPVAPWGPAQTPPQGQVTYMPLTPNPAPQAAAVPAPVQSIPAAPVARPVPAQETLFSKKRAILAVDEGTPVYSGAPILTPTDSIDLEGPFCNSPGCLKKHDMNHGHFTGSFGAYFFVPLPDSNAALVRVKNTPVGQQRAEDSFGHEVVAAPRFSLGYAFASGWGVRGSYWLLDMNQEAHASNSVNNPNFSVVSPLPNGFGLASPSLSLVNGFGADQFALNQSLRMHVWDVEATKEHCHGSCNFLGAFGARYVRVRQGYQGVQTNPGGNNGVVAITQDQQSVQATNVFDGVGPTLFLEIKHKVGLAGLSVYGNARGSVLFGTSHFDQTARVLRNETINGGALNVNNVTALSQSDNQYIPVAEFEFGLEYLHPIGHANLFLRGGFVGQRWFGLGTSTSPTGNLDFLGGSVQLGVYY